MNAPRATIDFETRSGCNLKTHGTWRYSTHKSTQILCLVYRLPHWKPGRTAVWHPELSPEIPETFDTDELMELFDWVAKGGLVEAHNVWFEFCIWLNVLVARFGWPEIPLAQWRCSAAKAATHALPRALEDATAALRLPITKDMEGRKVMMKMTKPRKSRKKEREAWEKAGVKPPKYLWWETVDLHQRVIAYCRTDVLAEELFSEKLPDIEGQELDLFLLDLQLNLRGFQIDRHAVKTAMSLISRERRILNRELAIITEGRVKKATQRVQMLGWLADNGVTLYNTQKATLDELMDTDGASAFCELTPATRRAVEIMRALGRSSTAKYVAMLNWMARDGRVRGGLLYHGASTGRWSGKGVQPHNFPKPTEKGIDVDDIWFILKMMERPIIEELYTSVMEALANALRSAITAGHRHVLYVADYSSIEARVLLWLARSESGLKLFREGGNLYTDMASSIYGRPITKADADEYQIGKIAILGLGYGMGASKFTATCEVMGGVAIEEDFAQEVVNVYRDEKYPEVKQLWRDTEDAAMKAVRTGKYVHQDRVTWFVQGSFLYCRLPSGRKLAYPFPKIQSTQTRWGSTRDALTFMGVDSYSHKWKRLSTYGGMLVENIVQAIARDLMAFAMLGAEKGGLYKIVLSVHDELVAECPRGQGDVHEFERLMAKCPPWATGIPVAAEGWAGFRYRK